MRGTAERNEVRAGGKAVEFDQPLRGVRDERLQEFNHVFASQFVGQGQTGFPNGCEFAGNVLGRVGLGSGFRLCSERIGDRLDVGSSPIQRCLQKIRLHRLGHVVVHADGQAALALTAHGGSREGDDADALTPGVRSLGPPDRPRGVIAVHLRHVAVHQDHIVDLALAGLDRLPSVHNHFGLVAELVEDQRGEAAVDVVVLGDEDAERGGSGSGILAGGNRSPDRADGSGHGTIDDRGDSGPLDRFGQEAFDAGHRVALPDGVRDGSGQDNPGRPAIRPGGQCPERIHGGGTEQVPVDDEQVRLPGSLQLLEQLGLAPTKAWVRAERDEVVSECEPGLGVVLGNHHMDGGVLGAVCPGRDADGNLEAEDGSGPGARADLVHLASHELDQPLADGQSQTCTTEPSRRGRIGLRERNEQPGDLFLGHPDAGIEDLEAEVLTAIGGGIAGHPQDDMTVLGELDRVAYQIEQDLSESTGVRTHAGRDIGADVDDEIQALLNGLLGEQVHDALDDDVEFEFLREDLDPRGLDL